MSDLPKITPQTVLEALVSPHTNSVDYESFMSIVDSLAKRLDYPDKDRLAKIVRAHLGRLKIEVALLPHISAAETVEPCDPRVHAAAIAIARRCVWIIRSNPT